MPDKVDISPTHYESQENIDKKLKGRHTRISILKNMSEGDLNKLQGTENEGNESEEREVEKKAEEKAKPKTKRLINVTKLLVRNWPFELET